MFAVTTTLARHADSAAFVAIGLLGTCWLWRKLGRWGLVGSSRRVVLYLLLGVMAIGATMTEHTDRRERERLRAMIQGFAPTYALSLQQAGYASMTPDTAPDDATYLRLIEMQKQWLQVNPHAHDIYTFHRQGDQILLVVDSETDYDRNGVYEGEREARTEIGEPYEPSQKDWNSIQRAFGGEHTFDGDVHGFETYVDRWGDWVSAYSPILGPDGRVLAIVGVDYDAATWRAAIAGPRRTTLSIFALMLLLTGGGTVVFQMLRERGDRSLLAEHNRQLAVANEELLAANQRALAANEAKTAFLAHMSHELRTPLTAILGFADLLLDSPLPQPEQRQHAETIRRGGQNLLTILTDILDLAKMDSGTFTVQPTSCSPRQVASEVIELLTPVATNKGIALRLEAAAQLPSRFATDCARLRQILINLVGNAIKFTDQGSVRLRVERDGGMLEFAVVDTGIGIAPEQQQRLFQPFSQVDHSTTRRHGGTGLGLAISRRLATLLGGDIDVQSRTGEGSTFRLRLPNTAPTSPETVETESKPRSDAIRLSGHVLLAEDGPDNQRLIGHLLRRAGLTVEVAANGREAVDRLLTPKPTDPACDLVLMDMQMPLVDGYEATRALRRAGLRLPIVALTAHAGSQHRDLCIDAGCDDYLTKPIDRHLLLRTLQQRLPSQERAAPAQP